MKDWAKGLVSHAMRQRRYYRGEPIDLALPDEIAELIEVDGQVEEIAQAAAEVRRQIADQLVLALGDQGQAKFGPTFYRVEAPEKWAIKEEARSDFFHWVKVHDIAPQLFNPNEARKKALYEMAELPDPETGEVYTRHQWMERFLDRTKLDKLVLKRIPEKRWAKFMARLPDGFIRRGGPTDSRVAEAEGEPPDEEEGDDHA